MKPPCVRYRVPGTISRLNIIEGQVVGAGIPELRVIEDVEYLHPKLQGNTLRELGFLHEREVDLPGVQRPNETVRSVAKSAYEATCAGAYTIARVVSTRRIKGRRGKGRWIDGQRMVLHPPGKNNGTPGTKSGL